jgi:hypothetical protein
MNLRSTLATAAVLSVTATMLAAAPASANDDDVIRRGSCSGATHWKVKAGPDDGRIEVEGEVDSNRTGQHWRWRMVHNGSVSARGTRVTTAPSGSFEVRRLLVDVAGQDTIVFRARNVRSGEICRGTVRI